MLSHLLRYFGFRISLISLLPLIAVSACEFIMRTNVHVEVGEIEPAAAHMNRSTFET